MSSSFHFEPTSALQISLLRRIKTRTRSRYVTLTRPSMPVIHLNPNDRKEEQTQHDLIITDEKTVVSEQPQFLGLVTAESKHYALRCWVRPHSTDSRLFRLDP